MIDPEKLPEKLIDLERKTVSPQVFADPEVHRLEQERISRDVGCMSGTKASFRTRATSCQLYGRRAGDSASRPRSADTRVPELMRHRGMLV
jgi:hypothetical protein